MAERTVTARLRLLVTEWVTPLEKARAATARFAGDTKAAMSGLNKELDAAGAKGRLNDIAQAAGAAGLIVGGAFLGIARSAAAFDKAMDEVNAVTDISAGQLQELADAAIAAGNATQYSAREAANAEAELARAGLTSADILGGGLRGALALAAAGQIGLEEAAVTTAKALNSFNLSGDQASHVADVLAAAANKSATNVHEMALASKMSSLVAAQMGLTLEDAAGALALFAQNGLAGSDGGTSFKVMLMMLSHPTKKSSELMKDLGISMFDAQGDFVGLASAAQQLHDKLGPLTQQQRNYAIAQIFGSDASRAANILYKEGAAGVLEFRDAVNDAGAAQRTASQLTDNLAGDWEKFTGALETFSIEAGGGANEGLRGLTQGATALVQAVGKLPTGVTSTVVIVGGLTAAGLLLVAAMLKVKTSVAQANAQLAKMGPYGAQAAVGLEKTAKFAAKAAAVLGALQVAQMLTSYMQAPSADSNKLAAGLDEWITKGKAGSEVTRVFGKNMSYLANELDIAQSGWGQFFAGTEDWVPGLRAVNEWGHGSSFQQAIEDTKALDDALTDLVRNGKADVARKAFEAIRLRSGGAEGLEGAKSVHDLQLLLPNYTFEIGQADKATRELTAGEEILAEHNVAVGKTWREAAMEAKGLIKIGDELSGATANWMRSEDKLRGTILAAQKTIKENHKTAEKGGKTLATNTEKAIENREAILDVRDATLEATQAAYNHSIETKSESQALKDAKAAFDVGHAALVQLGIDAGLSKDAAKNLADELLRMPKDVDIKVAAETAAAQAALDDVYAKTLRLKDKSIKISATVFWNDRGLHVPGGTILANRRGGVVEHAATGTLRDAAVYRTGSSPLYAFAEPSTGGEAFVPRNGDYGRSTAIIDHAARWYGGRFTAGPSGTSGSSQVINNNWTIQPQRADIGPNEMRAWQAAADARARVGRTR